MSSPLQNNITNLQSVLEAINALPEAGTDLPELSNPADASKALSGYEFINGDGEKVTGTIPTKTASNLTASGATVTVPAGYYDSQATKSVDTATQATPSVSIDSAGKITATATQTAGYVSAGTKTGTKQLTTQAAKTVTPSTSSQTAVASGIYTTGDVTVAAIPSSYVKPTSTKAATTYTPGTSNQTIAAGTYCSGAQTIKGDANLKAENIVSGVSIFGVAGSAEAGGGSGPSDSIVTIGIGAIKSTAEGKVIHSREGSDGGIETVENNFSYLPPTKEYYYPVGLLALNTQIIVLTSGTVTMPAVDGYTATLVISGTGYYIYKYV